jgi:hypothetical protein
LIRVSVVTGAIAPVASGAADHTATSTSIAITDAIKGSGRRTRTDALLRARFSTIRVIGHDGSHLEFRSQMNATRVLITPLPATMVESIRLSSGRFPPIGPPCPTIHPTSAQARAAMPYCGR